jgi:aryl-alcohol dehydrogenase-like predicted oxidoreductase
MLGRTGLAVSELALGGLFLASWFATPEGSAATVRRAVELGVNTIRHYNDLSIRPCSGRATA